MNSLKIMLLAIALLFCHNAVALPQWNPTLFPVLQNGKWGFIDASGQMKIAPNYQSASYFSEGLAAVSVNVQTGFWADGRPSIHPQYGFIDESGKMVIAPKYRLAMSFREGVAWVEDNRGPSGFIDHAGKIVVTPPNGTYCREFRDGLALAQPLLPSGAELVAPVPPGFTRRAEEPRKVGFIDKTGGYAIAPKFDYAWNFAEGLAAVTLDGKKWGFVDKTGAFAIAPQFDRAFYFSEGFAAVESGGKMIFIGKDGKNAFAGQYDEAQPFNSGLAAVRIGDKWGFINQTGALVIAPQWEEVATFFGDRAGVKINGKWGFIDKSGALIVAPNYDYAHFFLGELASVTFNSTMSDGAAGYINRAGKVVWEPAPKADPKPSPQRGPFKTQSP